MIKDKTHFSFTKAEMEGEQDPVMLAEMQDVAKQLEDDYYSQDED